MGDKDREEWAKVELGEALGAAALLKIIQAAADVIEPG